MKSSHSRINLLEQEKVSTEYQALTSEKDAVKKILTTNAQSSFKYFS